MTIWFARAEILDRVGRPHSAALKFKGGMVRAGEKMIAPDPAAPWAVRSSVPFSIVTPPVKVLVAASTSVSAAIEQQMPGAGLAGMIV